MKKKRDRSATGGNVGSRDLRVSKKEIEAARNEILLSKYRGEISEDESLKLQVMLNRACENHNEIIERMDRLDYPGGLSVIFIMFTGVTSSA